MTPLLEGVHKLSHTLGTRRRSRGLKGAWVRSTWGCWESSLEREEATGTRPRDLGTGRSHSRELISTPWTLLLAKFPLGIFPLAHKPQDPALSLPTSPQSPIPMSRHLTLPTSEPALEPSLRGQRANPNPRTTEPPQSMSPAHPPTVRHEPWDWGALASPTSRPTPATEHIRGTSVTSAIQ